MDSRIDHMEGIEKERNEDFWERKIKQHWKAFIVFVIGCIAALAGGILVLFWYIETTPIGDMGAATIGEWSLAWIWEFVIFLVLWEILIIGIPAAIALGIGWYVFWKRLSAEEKAEWKGREKKKHRGSSAGGGFGLVMFIAFSILMYLRGEFSTPLGNFPYSYLVYTLFTALGWLLLIVGIPAVIILIIVYFTVWRK
jgi:hypothetical protein